MASTKLASLIEFVSSEDRVCPGRWEDLRKLMEREASKMNISEKVPTPLILGGWWATNDGEKRERVIEQLKFSEKHGFLDKVDAFLRSLPAEDWHTCPDEQLHRPSVMDLNAEDHERRREVVLAAKKYYEELKSVEDVAAYNDINFPRHMWNFHIIISDNSATKEQLIEMLHEQIREYEEGLVYSEDHEVDFWKRRMSAHKADIIKLKICQLVETHQEVVGSDVMDFFEDIALDEVY